MKNILGNPSLFLEIFGQLSAKFVNTSLDNIDEEIIAAQKLICETTGIDRCSLWQFSEDHDSLIATHIWSDDDLKIAPNLVLSEMFPWFGARIHRGETVRIPSLDTLPPEA